MGGKSRAHEEATIESFRNDPAFAAEYLNAVLEDGDQAELMVALRYMASAFGGVVGWPTRPPSMPPRFIAPSRRRAILNSAASAPS